MRLLRASALALLLLSAAAPARPAHGWCTLPASVEAGRLPPEAREALLRIERGGPFPYRRDGATFSNRERILPRRPKGYYREYTVRTPGEKGRGTRRLVLGAEGERYYSSDHYQTFQCVEGQP